MIDSNRVVRSLSALALCAAAAAGLQGCVEMVVGTAVVGGSLAATDRRTFGAQTEDKEIVLKGENRASKLVGEAGHINVNSFNRKVLLTGEVKDEAMKAAVEREIGAIEGVKSIVNELQIGRITGFKSRSGDTLITGKVKASFVDAKDLQANAFKVITENGVVYLMGRVTPREGDSAGRVAAGVSGVTKVVKVFEYLTEDELRNMSTNGGKQQ